MSKKKINIMNKIIPCEINGYKILWYDSLTSTNDKATELALTNEDEHTAIIADYQTKGRGQRQNNWESEKGKNLTFSLILRPTFLSAENQFLLSKIASLAVCDYLKSVGLTPTIKWPNDIYTGDRKICGMLIENSLIGSGISFSVIGIGVNLNQEQFTNSVLNPVSVFQKTGKTTDIFEALNNLLVFIDKRYQLLKNNNTEKINTDYFENLYRRNGFHLYESNGKRFKAKIINILNTGELVLEDEKGTVSHFAFKEVNFILNE